MLGINFIVVGLGGRDIVTEKEVLSDSDFKADCIIVLGAQVMPEGYPSKMLKDRLDEGIRLYNAGAAPKILMSGDDGQVEYNEVGVMADYAENAGVSKEDLFLDHAGFSTYESMYRAQYIFGVKSAIVVTQKYHEYRALYIGQRLGIDVRGVSAVDKSYAMQGFRDVREVLARDKDFFQCILKTKPTYLGDKIDISGDGRQTQ
jgi:vancomycin permeability regulator SanA